MLSSVICSVGGAGVGGGNCWDGVAEQVSQVQSPFPPYCAFNESRSFCAQPSRAYPSIWPAASSLQRGVSTNPVVTMWVQ